MVLFGFICFEGVVCSALETTISLLVSGILSVVGKVKINIDPLFSSDSTVIFPP